MMKKVLTLLVILCLNFQAGYALIPDIKSDSKVHYTLTCLGVPIKKKALPTKLSININPDKQSKTDYIINNLETETYFTSKRKMFRKFIDYDKYPGFSFKGNNAPVKIKIGEKFQVKGKSTFHGVTKDVTLDLTPEMTDDNKILIKGKQVLQMTEYGLKPPKLGLIKIDNDITLKLEFYTASN